MPPRHRRIRQDVVLRRERPDDHAAVEQLQRVAFDDPDDLPSLVAALRRYRGRLPTVSIVAVAGDTVVGHTMLSAGYLDAPSRLVDVFVLSPLGVLPGLAGARHRIATDQRGVDHRRRDGRSAGVPRG